MPTRTGSSVDADGRVEAAAGFTLAASMSGSASSECTRVLLNARLDCISGASLSLGVLFIASLQQMPDFDIPEPHFVAEPLEAPPPLLGFSLHDAQTPPPPSPTSLASWRRRLDAPEARPALEPTRYSRFCESARSRAPQNRFNTIPPTVGFWVGY